MLTFFISSNQILSSSFIISVVDASANILKTSSRLVILSFNDSFFNHFKSLYSLVVISDHHFNISFVKIAYSVHCLTHLSFHSQVSSFLTSIDLSLCFIQSSLYHLFL
ncbi:MAG: hypothetical protein Q8M44_03170 [bacterium]|nr:hypothetical protein [bacterium]